MGAEINDFISSKVENQVKFLLDSIKDIEKGYGDMEGAMLKAAKSYDEILKRSKKIDTSLRTEVTERNQLAKAIDQIEKVNKKTIQTQDKLNKAYETENKKLIKKRAALNKTNKELRDNAKRQLEVEARTKAGIKNADKLTGAYDKLSRELREQKKLAKDLAVTYGESSDEYLSVQKEVTALDQRLKNLDGGLGDHQRKVGQYENALNELGDRYPALGVGIEAFNTKLAASGSISIATSAAFKALAKNIKTLGIIGLIAAAAGAVLKFVQLKKSIDENREAVANLTGETGNAADVITSKVSAIAKTYDKDFNEVLRSANTLAQELGITVPEALDAIGDGFATGADANGEFLEKLKEYPAQFSAAGLSAKESIAIISQEVKSGVYSDKGVDAIKEATIRLREMTPATKEAIDAIGLSSDELEKKLRDGSISYFDAIHQVSTKLGELPPQSVEVGTALADIFGGAGEDAGLNYITLLGDINTDLDQLKESSNDYQKTQERIRESNERISLTFNQLFGSSNNFFASVKANALEFVANFLERSIKAGVGLVNFFIDLYNEATLFRGAIELARANFAAFFNLINLGIENIIDGFKSVGKLLKAVFTRDFSSIKGIVKDAFKNIKENAVEFATETAKDYATAYKNTLSKEKVAFVDLSSEATIESAKKAGKDAAKAFDDGLEEGRQEVVVISKLDQSASKNVDEIDFNVDTSAADKALDEFGKKMDKERDKAKKGFKAIDVARIASNAAANAQELNAYKNLQKVRLAEGTISQREYTQLVQEEEIRRLEIELENLQKSLTAFGLKEDEVLKIKKKISDQLILVDNAKTQNTIDNLLDEVNGEDVAKAAKQALAESLDLVLTEINRRATERKLAAIDEDLERAEQGHTDEIERLTQQKEKGLITEEVFAKKKEQIDAKLAKKQQELKIKRFKSEKNAALAQATIDIASGILKTLASVPYPVAIPLIVAAGIVGAAQTAIIASQPIPKFAAGTKSAPEGIALVGEAGREILRYPSGQIAMAEGPTLTHLPLGTEVFNNRDTEQIIGAASGGKNEMSMTQIRQDINRGNAEIVKAIKNNRPIIQTRKGRMTDRRSSGHHEYYNRMVN